MVEGSPALPRRPSRAPFNVNTRTGRRGHVERGPNEMSGHSFGNGGRIDLGCSSSFNGETLNLRFGRSGKGAQTASGPVISLS